jgi:hypothetical protein
MVSVHITSFHTNNKRLSREWALLLLLLLLPLKLSLHCTTWVAHARTVGPSLPHTHSRRMCVTPVDLRMSGTTPGPLLHPTLSLLLESRETARGEHPPAPPYSVANVVQWHDMRGLVTGRHRAL